MKSQTVIKMCVRWQQFCCLPVYSSASGSALAASAIVHSDSVLLDSGNLSCQNPNKTATRPTPGSFIRCTSVKFL